VECVVDQGANIGDVNLNNSASKCISNFKFFVVLDNENYKNRNITPQKKTIARPNDVRTNLKIPKV